MLLEDASQLGGVQRAIPNTVWIHNQPRTPFADAEAGGFRAKDGDGEFSCLGFEHTPQGFADSWVAAVRADAEKQVPRRSCDLLPRHLRVEGIDFRRAH